MKGLKPKNYFNTFSIKDINVPGHSLKPDLNIYNSMVTPQVQMSNHNSTAFSNISNISKFKNRKNYEKENRRMTLELVK